MSSLVAALGRVACENAQRLAVVDAARQWSYRELAAQARAVACALSDAGAQAGDHVLLSMLPDGAGIAAMWGCWLAGTSFVPIEARAPHSHNQQIAELTGARLILSARELELAGLTRVRVAEPAESAEFSGPLDLAPPEPNQPGYVIFTSGSTGTPKGVAVDGGALLAHCTAVIEFEEIDAGSVVSQFHELTFDPPQQYLWAGLLAGACVAAKPPNALPPARFRDFLCQRRVHSAGVATRYLTILASSGVLNTSPPPMLRWISVGGEALPVEVARLFQRSRWGDVGLINYYGPTEGVVAVTGYRLPVCWEPMPGARSVPVGEALGDRRVELWPAGQLAGQDVGELVVLGQPRALGYLGITDDRFSGSGCTAVLRTGDLAVRRPGQGFEILGRLDDQVKVAGYRVDLGEIEHVLRDTPGIADLAVVALRTGFDTALGACLVPNSDAGAEQVLEAVRKRAAELLPHQRPTRYMLADGLPLTGNGKADRVRLASKLAGDNR